MHATLLATLITLTSCLGLAAQEFNPGGTSYGDGKVVEVAWSLGEAKAVAGGDALIPLYIDVKIGGDYHIYGLKGELDNEYVQPTSFEMVSADGRVAAEGKISASRAPKWVDTEYTGRYSYWEQEVRFTQVLRLKDASSEEPPAQIEVKLGFMACNDSGCLPPDEAKKTLELPVVAAAAALKQAGSGAADAQPGAESDGEQDREQANDSSRVVKLKWTVDPATKNAAGEVSFLVHADLEIEAPYHVYGLKGVLKNPYVVPTDLQIASADGRIEAQGSVRASREPKFVQSEFNGDYTYWEGAVRFTQRVVLSDANFAQAANFTASLAYMACTDEGCLAQTREKAELVTPTTAPVFAETPEVSENTAALEARLDGERLDPTEDGVLLIELGSPATLGGRVPTAEDIIFFNVRMVPAGKPTLSGSTLRVPVRTDASDVDEGNFDFTGKLLLGEGRQIDFGGEVLIKRSIMAFLVFAALAALIALLTPCVFPMIPITVSFFTKQAETSKVSPKVMGLVYGVGIVGSFTAIGAIFTLVLGPAGATDFATHPITLGLIGGLFILFALSLFGAFEIQLPSGLMQLAGGAQSKGGVIGVWLLGTMFAITTFTCTAPFVGGLLAGAAASGEWTRPLVGMIVFSSVLAIPFIFLAIFPSRLKKLPKSGGWLNEVKVIMGFIEVMAAFKFLGDMGGTLQIDTFSRQIVLLVWIICLVMMGLYLLGTYRLPKDSPRQKTSVLAMLLAMGCFLGALAFVPGMRGELVHPMVEAYLPTEKVERTPEGRRSALVKQLIEDLGPRAAVAGAGEEVVDAGPPKPGQEQTHFKHELINDYEGAKQLALRLKRPLFIDFTGYSCPNCRTVEKSTFRDPAVKKLLNEKFVVATLFTDGRSTAENPDLKQRSDEQQEMLKRISKTVTNPYYVVADPNLPDEKNVLAGQGYSQSFVSDPQIFADWLEKNLKIYERLNPK